MGEQQGQYLELLLGERQFFAVQRADFAPEVHAEPFEGDRLLLRLSFGRAPQDAPHAGQHLAHRERLGDVVVGPEVQSGDRVVFGVLRRAEDHRDLRRRGVVFQQPGHPEAAHFAHHDIEQDQRITLGVHSEGLLGAVRHIDLVTLDFEVELQDLAQRLFVIDHQDFVFCHTYEV